MPPDKVDQILPLFDQLILVIRLPVHLVGIPLRVAPILDDANTLPLLLLPELFFQLLNCLCLLYLLQILCVYFHLIKLN